MNNNTSVYLLSTKAKTGLFIFLSSLIIILIFRNGITEESINFLLINIPQKFILFFGLIYLSEYIATNNKNAIAKTILIPLLLIISMSQITIYVDMFVSQYIDNYILSLFIMFLPPLISSYILVKRSKQLTSAATVTV